MQEQRARRTQSMLSAGAGAACLQYVIVARELASYDHILLCLVRESPDSNADASDVRLFCSVGFSIY